MEIFVQMQMQIMMAMGLIETGEEEESGTGWEPFCIEIEIESIGDLIQNCLTKEPYSIC